MIRNITMSAEEKLIMLARQKAQSQHKSLNLVFREWLGRYARWPGDETRFVLTMKKLQYVEPGRKLTREEMNER